jgi:hypothetical protein
MIVIQIWPGSEMKAGGGVRLKIARKSLGPSSGADGVSMTAEGTALFGVLRLRK